MIDLENIGTIVISIIAIVFSFVVTYLISTIFCSGMKDVKKLNDSIPNVDNKPEVKNEPKNRCKSYNKPKSKDFIHNKNKKKF